MDKYTKIVECKCFNCHAISMEKVEIDYDAINAAKQFEYNQGFNDGYKKAKEELRVKLGLENF